MKREPLLSDRLSDIYADNTVIMSQLCFRCKIENDEHAVDKSKCEMYAERSVLTILYKSTTLKYS